jgi:hypothetical protein
VASAKVGFGTERRSTIPFKDKCKTRDSTIGFKYTQGLIRWHGVFDPTAQSVRSDSKKIGSIAM